MGNERARFKFAANIFGFAVPVAIVTVIAIVVNVTSLLNLLCFVLACFLPVLFCLCVCPCLVFVFAFAFYEAERV